MCSKTRRVWTVAFALTTLLLSSPVPSKAGPGGFIDSGSLNTARDTHTATLLNNGMVLIVGGEEGAAPVASAELYNPATGTFTQTGSLNVGRWAHTATLLGNGMVLIAGGFNSGTGAALSSAELYDPSSGTFTMTGSLSGARGFHTATLLSSGLVLLAGGESASGVGTILATAELYNRSTGTFTPTGNMNLDRAFHTSTLLSSGEVLVAGGKCNSTCFSASAEFTIRVKERSLPRVA